MIFQYYNKTITLNNNNNNNSNNNNNNDDNNNNNDNNTEILMVQLYITIIQQRWTWLVVVDISIH